MVSIGDDLLDGYGATSSWLKANVKWIEDIAEFYRERAAIEREHAAKLSALTAKHFSKKAAHVASISVGEKPAKTPGSLESASATAWTEVLNQTEEIAKDHKELADQLAVQIADQLSGVRQRCENLQSYYSEFHGHIEEDRDSAYNAVKRGKPAYDDACQSMEHARTKNKKVEQKENDMYNAKSSYLIAINVANRMKDKFYHDDLPEVLDGMQLLAEARTCQMNRILKMACDTETSHLNHRISCLKKAHDVVAKNARGLDTAMFIDHNKVPWQDPTDFYFQPSPIWHDDDTFKTDENGLKYLRGRLATAEEGAEKAGDVSEAALSKFEAAKSELGKLDLESMSGTALSPLLNNFARCLQDLIRSETKRLSFEVEIETIEAATAGCDLSGVPITRTKTKRTVFGKKKEVVEVIRPITNRDGNRLGLRSLLSRTAKHLVVSGPGVKVLYDFEAEGPGEITVLAGEKLPLLEPDNGSGWVKVRSGLDTGIVPSSYVEVFNNARGGLDPFSDMASKNSNEGAGAGAAPPAPPPSRGKASSTTMTALYDFDGADLSQLSIRAGDQITVIEADPGNGWTTGELNGQRGIFPTNYAN